MKQKKLKQIIILNGKWIILVLCLLNFFILSLNVFNQTTMNEDTIGYEFISHFINENTTIIMKGITWFGSGLCLSIITTLSIIFLKNKKIGLTIIGNLFIITSLNLFLKFLLQRPRPTEYRIIEETGYSFPSGHSMISMAFYGFLIYLISKHIKNKYVKRLLIVLLSTLIISIGISRIYLGVHYTSDVVGGFLIAISYLIIYIGIVNNRIFNKQEN